MHSLSILSPQVGRVSPTGWSLGSHIHSRVCDMSSRGLADPAMASIGVVQLSSTHHCCSPSTVMAYSE